ncbi:IS66 Orf2 like protein [compost metagenome]
MSRLDDTLTVYLHRPAIDFRTGINGLAILVEQALGMNPFAAAVYVFSNRQRNRVKILVWERNGFWLLMKRLEQDRFIWPDEAVVPTLSSQWVKLERFVTSGHYPLDNNACENSIRPFFIGSRNGLFADTVAGANASANLYSLLETCKVNGVDGYQHPRSLLVALPRARTVDDYETLLLWRIAALKT